MRDFRSLKYPRLYSFSNSTKSAEPAAQVGISVSSVAGILSLAQFFFPGWLDDRGTNFILVAVAFLLPIITAVLTRPKVWSPASVEELIQEALAEAEEVKKPKGPKLL